MKNPNGYGSIINLGANRRKPFAIRVSCYEINEETNEKKQKYKYIGYYEKSKDAIIALANYNTGLKIKEHISISEQPTFSQIYKDWIEYKISKNKSISSSTLRNYNLAYGWCKPLHEKKLVNIRIDDIQSVASLYKNKSEATVSTIKTVMSQMYQYAMKHELVDKNYALMADWEYVVSEEKSHKSFTEEEIDILWKNKDIEDVDLILMMIYTGFRASEFIAIENASVHLDEKYVVGGMKTEAGRNRTVALCDKVLPLFQNRYGKTRYLIPNSKNKKYSYGVFYLDIWNRVMTQLGMDHTPHDTRYTFASLLDRGGANKVCIKLLIGHAIQDITDGVYIQKTLKDLLEAVNVM